MMQYDDDRDMERTARFAATVTIVILTGYFATIATVIGLVVWLLIKLIGKL